MPSTPSRHRHFSGRDTKVLFAINFQDGRTAYFRVSPQSADHGNIVVADIAREAQERGEIPAGTIIGVKRVR
jgi:hypothetical protein